MKKIILINSYCDTQEKIDVLFENLNILKSFGLDTFLYSPIIIPNNIIECCTYFMYNKENPVLHFPEKGVFCYNVSDFNGKRYTIRKMLKDYGWANLYQFKKLSEVALTFDYTHFYNIIYDLIIDDDVIKNILSDKESSFFKFHEHDVSLHLIILNKDNLQKVLPSLTLENYLSDKSNFAEKFLHTILKSKLPNGVFENVYVNDKIFYYGKEDQFNYSDIDGIKYFIIKDYYNNNSIKIYFYQIPENIKININNLEFKINERDLIDLGVFNMDNITIKFDDFEYSIKDKISDIVHNTIEITDL
jgi:hypothetical protein